MNKSIIFETTHTASIAIRYLPDLSREEENIADDLILDQLVYFIADVGRDGSVTVNPDFRCNLLTEVGLIGTNIEDVEKVANMVIDWVNKSKYFETFEYN